MSLRSAPSRRASDRKQRHISHIYYIANVCSQGQAFGQGLKAVSPYCGFRFAGRERASSTSAPPFTKLLIIFSQGRLHFCGRFCVEKVTLCQYQDPTETAHIKHSFVSTRRRYTLPKQFAVSVENLLIFP